MKNPFEGSTVYQEPRRDNIQVEVERVMEDVAKDTERLLFKLREAIDTHQYQVILGIDGGGRVPGLLLGSVLKKVYQHDGVPLPKTTFIAGSREKLRSQERVEVLKEYFSLPLFQSTKEAEKKVLLVEDVVRTGASIQDIEEALRTEGIAYDIATLSKSSRHPTSPVTFANITSTAINRNRTMSGVHKSPDSLFSQTLRRPLDDQLNSSSLTSQHEGGKDEETQDTIEYASDSEVLQRTRELVRLYAEKLAHEFIAGRDSHQR